MSRWTVMCLALALGLIRSTLAATAVEQPVASEGASVAVTAVAARRTQREIELPAELWAYQNVALYPRVQGFVQSIRVDRGSEVRRGDVLVRLVAPELASQRSEAEAKWQAARAQALESEAKHA